MIEITQEELFQLNKVGGVYLKRDVGSILLKVREEKEEPRRCTCCKKEMSEGYCIEGGEEYFCSDKCLITKYTEEEFTKLYDNGNGDSYWTEWQEWWKKILLTIMNVGEQLN